MALRIRGNVKPFQALRIKQTAPLVPPYVPPVNPKPPAWTFTPGYLGTFAELVALDIPLDAYDVDNDIHTYEVISGALPNGLSINNANGHIIGTVANIDQDTIYNFTVKVTDKTGLFVTGNFNMIVSNVATTVTWTTTSADLPELEVAQVPSITLQAVSN
jgi:hypothetical protein